MNRPVAIAMIVSVVALLTIFLFADPKNNTVANSLVAVLVVTALGVGFRPRKSN